MRHANRNHQTSTQKTNRINLKLWKAQTNSPREKVGGTETGNGLSLLAV